MAVNEYSQRLCKAEAELHKWNNYSATSTYKFITKYPATD